MKIPAMITAELRRLTSTKMAVLALIALLAVPILYGGLYLWANQDPYGQFSEVPVALVVDDAGAEASGDSPAVNYGDQVADDLLEDGSFDWHRFSAEEAKSALQHGDVDFTVTIPADFSQALTSVSGDDPHQARIELETNDANNYLASTIGDQAVERIRRSVAELVGREAAGQLLGAISDIRSSMADAADGASRLTDGATDAHKGSKTLHSGAAALADGAKTLSDGAHQVADGTDQLVPGAEKLSDGAHQVAGGTAELAGYADAAGDAVQRVTDALPAARRDLAQRLRDQGLTSDEIDDVLATLDPLADRVREGDTKVQAAVGQVDRLAAGADQVADGADTLAAGTKKVADGASQVAEGTDAAVSGSKKLSRGSADLEKGLSTLADGSKTLRDGLRDGVAQLPDSDAELRHAQAKTISDPVDIESGKVASAADYGAGLAPFFAALAGWIGIYALFLIVKPISRRAVTALRRPVRVTLAGWLTPALLGALQMAGLFGVLMFALGFGFDNPWGTLGIMVAASVTYTAIILALNVWLGSVGQFLGLVLMVLQLVVAGGTFPWQTLPAPLASLHHVLPMGFVVDAMRQLMYGGELSRVWSDLTVLAGWLVAALVLAVIGVTRMTHRRTLRDLQPSLIG